MLTHFPQAVPEIPVSNVSKREVDELFERWKETGAKIIEAVEDKPWNLREFRVADLDGNQLRVFYDFNWEIREERR